MKTSNLVLIVGVIVLVFSLLAVWFYPSLKDFMESNTFWNGLSDFTDTYHATHLDSLDTLNDQSGNAILFAIPGTNYTPGDLARIGQFVDAGNTLVLMNKYGYGNEILQYLGIKARFDDQPILDPLFCYKNEYLPLVSDFSPEIKAAGIQSIVLNHAGIITNIDNSQALAWSSSESFLDLDRNGTKSNDEPGGPFIAAAQIKVGRGTVNLISDPSMIINSMIDKNDNRKFVAYLTSLNGVPDNYLIDRSHLSKSPLDDLKILWNEARVNLANPYVTLGLIVVVFLIVIRYTLRKGDLLG